jgi:hypothetical protein
LAAALIVVLDVVYGVGWDSIAAFSTLLTRPEQEVVQENEAVSSIGLSNDGNNIDTNIRLLMSGDDRSTDVKLRLRNQMANNTLDENAL